MTSPVPTPRAPEAPGEADRVASADTDLPGAPIMTEQTKSMINNTPPGDLSCAPETPIPITLRAVDWNTVMGCIAKQPWDVAEPLMQAIRQQVVAHIQDYVPGQSRPNGMTQPEIN